MKWKRSKKALTDTRKDGRKDGKENSGGKEERGTVTGGGSGGGGKDSSTGDVGVTAAHDTSLSGGVESEDEIDVQEDTVGGEDGVRGVVVGSGRGEEAMSPGSPSQPAESSSSAAPSPDPRRYEVMYDPLPPHPHPPHPALHVVPPPQAPPTVTSASGGSSMFSGQYQHVPLSAALLTKLPPEAEHLYRPYVS
ncbi:hypothetical protein E2C01_087684 [Portunus trituberculatus]|uniref:Uncharacterized protein n=1 Tax=Portunus trituberculatus TaxID=210409 RepID=A0A5B7JH56_PORTR|nr:hypothetical protein [Portunus trituberculatus]